jgi:hypothetical protein
MRLLALLLLLANAGFFAWAQYAPQMASPESHLLDQQIKPESIRLLSPAEVLELSSGKTVKGVDASCREWGPFAAADLERAQALLQPVAASARISERRGDDGAGWWVFMPPQPTRQGAIQKVAELKQLGVDEYFVVQDDPKLRFAISLGIFRTEEAARTRLEELRARGVRSAQVGQRQTPMQRVYLQLQGVGDSLQPRLAELKQAFPSADLKECTAG